MYPITLVHQAVFVDRDTAPRNFSTSITQQFNLIYHYYLLQFPEHNIVLYTLCF